MRTSVVLGAIAGTFLLGTLMYCAPTASVSADPDDAGVCDPDSGTFCPCDPSTYKPSDCYSGPKGTNGKGICKAGKRSCVAGKLSACVGEVLPKTETCNLADDDCNGTTDDVPEIIDAAAIGYCTSPACDPSFRDAAIYCYSGDPGICGAGRKTCAPGTAGGTPTGCEPFIKSGAPEECNGVDDDCNGSVDDGLTDLGDCDADGGVGECAKGKGACNNGLLFCPNNEPVPEKCDGKDNNCDGQIDNGSITQLCGNTYYTCTNGKCMFVCPYVFSYDGEKFAYETSVGGASLVGQEQHLTNGKPIDFVPMWSRLNHAKLDWSAGTGTLRTKLIASEDEIVYFDSARVTVIEHEPGYEILTSTSIEWNTLGTKDPQAFYALKTAGMRVPLSAIWTGGARRADVTGDLGRIDRIAAAHDIREANFYDVDFGAVKDVSHARVVIDGWKYKEPRDLRDGVKKEHPRLEVRQLDGTYKKALDIATPRGDDKPVSFDLSKVVFPTGRYEMRIVTGTHEAGNAMWYVDRVRLTEDPLGAVTQREIPIATAALSFTGAPSEPSFGDHTHARIALDDGKGELTQDQRTWGAFTRYGDVRDLLGTSDDRMVIMRRGDGVELRFDGIAPATTGKEVTVFMMTDLLFKPRKWLTAKVGTPLTQNVEPLPYHGMGIYPPPRPFPNDAAHAAWRAQYETRTYLPGDPRWGK
ncbi:hypothetical protein BH09MYX1_BH09MYX1_36900 [soil metagenome]